ncbi:hypothetical protein PL321_03390 [Caloramator sp. mosi_1]|uniref:hypothetical protein n=1 Tax=Caloramator sp. mosi_1 TaxID=3023090 RepID=UPI00235E0FEF|nr:hypothetical protein [Caloramator sp. mosi_1]WDC84718.1 hypothetical protein PL321_03390 [Caloramator sp. mosi_1]
MMKDLELKGIYSAEVELSKATYSDIKVKIDDKEYVYPEMTLNEGKKLNLATI